MQTKATFITYWRKKGIFSLYPHSWLLIIIFLLAIGMRIFNYFTHQYFPVNYIDFGKLFVLCGVLIYYFSTLISDTLPTFGFLLYGMWIVIISVFAGNFFALAIQTTPFHLYDYILYQWDTWLGFSSLAIMNWTYHFVWFSKLCQFTYNSMLIELFAAPLVLLFSLQKNRFSVLINLMLITMIIGFSIYYFFPTSAPAHVINSPYFTQSMKGVYRHFYAIQHHLPLNVDSIRGGIIGFPSFHVIWAISITYITWNYPKIFWPLLFWNSLIIYSTLGLGWHFLVDDIASIIITPLTIILAEYWSFGKDHTCKKVKMLYRKDLMKARNKNTVV